MAKSTYNIEILVAINTELHNVFKMRPLCSSGRCDLGVAEQSTLWISVSMHWCKMWSQRTQYCPCLAFCGQQLCCNKSGISLLPTSATPAFFYSLTKHSNLLIGEKQQERTSSFAMHQKRSNQIYSIVVGYRRCSYTTIKAVIKSWAQGGDLRIESCSVNSTTGAGVGSEGGVLTIRESNISNNRGNGVVCVATLNGQGADCKISGSRIGRNNLNGILAREDSRLSVRDSAVSYNRQFGVQIKVPSSSFSRQSFIHTNSQTHHRTDNVSITIPLSMFHAPLWTCVHIWPVTPNSKGLQVLCGRTWQLSTKICWYELLKKSRGCFIHLRCLIRILFGRNIVCYSDSTQISSSALAIVIQHLVSFPKVAVPHCFAGVFLDVHLVAYGLQGAEFQEEGNVYAGNSRGAIKETSWPSIQAQLNIMCSCMHLVWKMIDSSYMQFIKRGVPAGC